MRIYRINLIYMHNMVYNTITNNMENNKMSTSTKHTNATILEALGKLNSGWTRKRVAAKYHVSPSTVTDWKKRFPSKLTKTTRKVTKTGTVNNLVNGSSLNGLTHDAGIEGQLLNVVPITFDAAVFSELKKVAEREIRTIEGQIRFLIQEDLNKRNRMH